MSENKDNTKREKNTIIEQQLWTDIRGLRLSIRWSDDFKRITTNWILTAQNKESWKLTFNNTQKKAY